MDTQKRGQSIPLTPSLKAELLLLLYSFAGKNTIKNVRVTTVVPMTKKSERNNKEEILMSEFSRMRHEIS